MTQYSTFANWPTRREFLLGGAATIAMARSWADGRSRSSDIDVSAFRTPYKYNKLVLEASGKAGDFDAIVIDTPLVFPVDRTFYMMYIGFDGIGYQTGLATSNDLINWRKLGVVMARNPQSQFTKTNIAVTSILRDDRFGSSGAPKKIGGRYLSVWHAYPGTGYEEGPAVIGLAWSHDLHNWTIGDPILFPEDGASWERGGLYKGHLMEVDGVYFLFYSAKNVTRWPWHEQIGVATSRDLKHWNRHSGNPVITHGPKGTPDERFAADPFVMRQGKQWIVFYYGLSEDFRAGNFLAIGSDPYNFVKLSEPLIDVGAPGSIDDVFAHKPYIISWQGDLYHFYNAVSLKDRSKPHSIENESRGISVARSRPW